MFKIVIMNRADYELVMTMYNYADTLSKFIYYPDG